LGSTQSTNNMIWYTHRHAGCKPHVGAIEGNARTCDAVRLMWSLNQPSLNQPLQVFAAGEDTALAPLTPDINKALSKAAPEERQEILQHFADKYLSTMRSKVPADWAAKQRQPKAASTSAASARIADKMLRNLWLVGYIHMLLPNACIVHVVRHPMDVALSCYAQPFGYSAAALAWSWDMSAIASQLQMTWELAEHWAEQLPGRIHTGEEVIWRDACQQAHTYKHTCRRAAALSVG